jgi:hypothetical protein
MFWWNTNQEIMTNFFIFLPYLGQTNCTLGRHEIYPTTFSIISSFYCFITCHSARCYFTDCCDVKLCHCHIKYSLTMTGDSLMCHSDDLRPSKGQLEYNFFFSRAIKRPSLLGRSWDAAHVDSKELAVTQQRIGSNNCGTIIVDCLGSLGDAQWILLVFALSKAGKALEGLAKVIDVLKYVMSRLQCERNSESPPLNTLFR